MNLFDSIADGVLNVCGAINSVKGAAICSVADVADTVKFRGSQFAKDVATPVTTRVESLVDFLKP